MELDIFKELEDALNEEETSTVIIPDTTTPCADCEQLAFQNQILQKEVDALMTAKSVPGGTSEECEDCQMLYLENIALKQKSDIQK
ncbi:hypothetical protein CEXT_500801 [Caerostris extrusa]|uniref:Uncharacterized protein n=1 Tax=Caerostris extrusa TaxID=172846 RepID=A0AAV4MV36_CAEEX|nr:hypothetical protein CEXT_500801 [Caerostris extrusa]